MQYDTYETLSKKKEPKRKRQCGLEIGQTTPTLAGTWCSTKSRGVMVLRPRHVHGLSELLPHLVSSYYISHQGVDHSYMLLKLIAATLHKTVRLCNKNTSGELRDNHDWEKEGFHYYCSQLWGNTLFKRDSVKPFFIFGSAIWESIQQVSHI